MIPSRATFLRRSSVSAGLRLGGVPSPLTALIGRASELDETLALLRKTRLLTLTGAGGSGKTHLALELVWRAQKNFRDGVAWPAKMVRRAGSGPDLRVMALGPFEVFRKNVPIAAREWGSSKARELFLLLLCQPNGSTKDRVATALWPDASPAQVRNNFHVRQHVPQRNHCPRLDRGSRCRAATDLLCAIRVYWPLAAGGGRQAAIIGQLPGLGAHADRIEHADVPVAAARLGPSTVLKAKKKRVIAVSTGRQSPDSRRLSIGLRRRCPISAIGEWTRTRSKYTSRLAGGTVCRNRDRRSTSGRGSVLVLRNSSRKRLAVRNRKRAGPIDRRARAKMTPISRGLCRVRNRRPGRMMTRGVDVSRVHLINPSHVSFGVAVITPRWLYVLAAATGTRWGDPNLIDESLEETDVTTIAAGDVVGIGIHTGNARRGYELGKALRARGAWVVYGGIHATLYPEEAHQYGGAHAVVKGDGDLIWASVVEDCFAGRPAAVYDGGRVSGQRFVSARWDLLPEGRYMWASVQTVRGCPKHCSFCSVWRTDGQEPRQREADPVIREIVDLRRKGFRFIALADDNFYPVTFDDLAQARRRSDPTRLRELEAMREERFTFMRALAKLPDDLVFYTQITMEAAEDAEFLKAMRKARIRGALVGVEAVTPEGLKDVYKGFNLSGDALVQRLRAFREHDVHVLGSFIFGLPSDRKDTFDATVALAEQADLTFAQFVLLTPFPGTVDFEKWEREEGRQSIQVDGVPITRHWLIPQERRPKLYAAHPTMSFEEIRVGTQHAWDRFYSWHNVWTRSRVVKSLRSRLAFVLISKLYRQMYANTGIATDSARVARSARWARWMGLAARRLFIGAPMPTLQVPQIESEITV